MAKEFDYLFKIIIVGAPHVGKSSLMTTFVTNTFQNSSYIPTIGIDLIVRTIQLDGKEVKVRIWDTAGIERFAPITELYYRGGNGMIIVYDVTNQHSFGNVKFLTLSSFD